MIYINKTIKFIKHHKVFFFICLFLPVYHWLIVNEARWFEVKPISYSYHAVDYSMGFCSRILPGEIYYRLVGVYSQTAVSVYLLFVYALFIIMLALLVDRFALKFCQKQKACFVLLIFFLTGPVTFNVLVSELGMLDFYWALFFLMACLCLKNKYLKFTVPLFVVLMVMTHYAALACYAAALMLIILFFAAKSDSKKEKITYLCIFVFSFIIGIGLALYFLTHDSSNLVYNVDEFRNILQKDRNALSFYYDYSFYKYFGSEYANTRLYAAYSAGIAGEEFMYTKNIFEIALHQIKANLQYTSISQLVISIVLGLIPQSLLIYILVGYFKKKPAKKKRWIFVLFLLLCIGCELVGCFFSNDTPRWVGNSVIILFVFTLYILHYEYEQGMERVEALFQKIGYPLVYGFLFFYSNMVMDAYTLQL